MSLDQNTDNHSNLDVERMEEENDQYKFERGVDPLRDPKAWGLLCTRELGEEKRKQEGLYTWDELPKKTKIKFLGSEAALSQISPGNPIYVGVFDDNGHLQGMDPECVATHNIQGNCANCNRKDCPKKSYLVDGKSGTKTGMKFTMLVCARAELGTKSLALFQSTDPEIRDQKFALVGDHGPVTVSNPATGTDASVQFPQYGTLGFENKYDRDAKVSPLKAQYRVQASTVEIAPGHEPLTLMNGEKVMALNQVASLVLSYLLYRLTLAHIQTGGVCNGGDSFRREFRRTDRHKALKKEYQKRLKDGEYGAASSKAAKDAMKDAFEVAEMGLFAQLLREEVHQSWTIDGSSKFFPPARPTQQRVRNEETGEYEKDASVSEKGGPSYFTFRQALLSSVYNNSYSHSYPSEEILGFSPDVLELSLAATNKKFNHVPLYSAEDPSKELPAEVRNSLLPGAWFTVVFQLQPTQTATGNDTRARLKLVSVQYLQNGDEGGRVAAQDTSLLKPIRFGQPLLAAPPAPASKPSPAREKASRPRQEEGAGGQEPVRKKKRQKRLGDLNEESGPEDDDQAKASLLDDEADDSVEPTQEIDEEDMAPLE